MFPFAPPTPASPRSPVTSPSSNTNPPTAASPAHGRLVSVTGVLAGLGLLLGLHPHARADVTYSLINYPAQQAGGTLSGSITVVDSAADDGLLQAGEIVRWGFTLTNGGNTTTVDSVTTPFASLSLSGTVLLVGTDILIPRPISSGSNRLNLAVLPPPGSISDALLSWQRSVISNPCNSQDGYRATDLQATPPDNDDVTYWSTTGTYFSLGGTDPWRIATNPNAPRPGACCIPATGACIVISAADCAAVGGTFAGYGSTCAAAGCVPVAPVPTTCPASFSTPSFSTAGTNPLAAATADLNGDGFADTVITSGQSAKLSVMLGNGDGTFRPSVLYPTGTAAGAVAISDFNADGWPDLAVACFGGGTDMLLNLGNGTFAPAINVGYGGQHTGIATGDFNGDGRPDLVVTRGPFNAFGIILATGNGTFAPPVTTSMGAGANPGPVTVADLNGDGFLDLIIGSSLSGGAVSVYNGNGDGTFTASQFISAGGPVTSLALADFSGDGRTDLAATVYPPGMAILMLGSAGGTLQAPVNYDVGQWPSSITAGDFNNDGAPDIAVVNHGPSTVTVRLGNRTSSNTFGAPTSYPEGDRPFGLATADFNNDGRTDFVCANYWGNNVAVLLNTGAATGFAQQPQSQTVSPGAAATFSATVTGTGPFTYQWRRNGLPIIGATSSALTINNASSGNAGVYDVQVRGGCNPAALATSYPAVLTIDATGTPGCLADLVGGGDDGLVPDGTIDGSDFIAFINAFAAGC